MKITVGFLNGSDYWRDKILSNARLTQTILSSPYFLSKVSTWSAFDATDKTPEEVANALTADVTITVGFYWRPIFAKAIASESEGCVYFNTAKESQGAGGAGNIAHEVMHALGFEHNGNSPAGQGNTVPWRIASMVEEFLNETQQECPKS